MVNTVSIMVMETMVVYRQLIVSKHRSTDLLPLGEVAVERVDRLLIVYRQLVVMVERVMVVVVRGISLIVRVWQTELLV